MNCIEWHARRSKSKNKAKNTSKKPRKCMQIKFSEEIIFIELNLPRFVAQLRNL